MLNIWHHVVHIQDRLLGGHIDVCIAEENDNSIDGNISAKYKPPQRLDMTIILLDGIPQLMLLGKSVALIAGVRQILLPELSITAAINLPVDIFCLQHKDAVAGDNNIINRCSVIAVANQKIIVNPIVIAVQLLHTIPHYKQGNALMFKKSEIEKRLLRTRSEAGSPQTRQP